jgi:hypothetical protein
MLFRLVSMTAFQSSRRHLQEHAVARDAGVVDQHVDRAVLGLGLGEGLDGGVPVGHVADRGVEV